MVNPVPAAVSNEIRTPKIVPGATFETTPVATMLYLRPGVPLVLITAAEETTN